MFVLAASRTHSRRSLAGFIAIVVRPGLVGKLQKIFEQAISQPRKEQELVARFVATLLEQQKKAS